MVEREGHCLGVLTWYGVSGGGRLTERRKWGRSDVCPRPPPSPDSLSCLQCPPLCLEGWCLLSTPSSGSGAPLEGERREGSGRSLPPLPAMAAPRCHQSSRRRPLLPSLYYR